jgi:hypothetical protein
MSAASSEIVPPAPPESKQTIQIPPNERAKAAVDAFHEVRAELRALLDAKPAADPRLMHAKQLQLTTVQNGALEAAKINLEKQKRLAVISEAQLTEAKGRVAVAISNYNSATSAADIRYYRETMTSAEAVEVVAENAAMRGRQNLADAMSLKQQAEGTPKGNLQAAHDNLTKARGHYVAAEIKLKGASDSKITGVAQKEFDAAAKPLADAELESRLAEKAVTDARHPDTVLDNEHR